LFDNAVKKEFVKSDYLRSVELPVKEIGSDILISRIIKPVYEDKIAMLEDFINNPREKELDLIIREIFYFLSEYKYALHIFERNRVVFSEYYEFWDSYRRRFLDLFDKYLKTRIQNGVIRPLKNITLTTRMLMDSIALYSLNRFYDEELRDRDDQEVLEVVLDILVPALSKEE
jgi:hypothetical protein